MSYRNVLFYGLIGIALGLGFGSWLAVRTAEAQEKRPPALQHGPKSDVVSFEWAIDEPNAEKARKLLDAKGGHVQEGERPFVPPPEEKAAYSHPSFAPLVIIAGAIAVGYLADIAYQIYQDKHQPGVIIDARVRPPVIRQRPELPPCTVLVLVLKGEPKTFTCRSVAEWKSALQTAVSALAPAAPKP